VVRKYLEDEHLDDLVLSAGDVSAVTVHLSDMHQLCAIVTSFSRFCSGKQRIGLASTATMGSGADLDNMAMFVLAAVCGFDVVRHKRGRAGNDVERHQTHRRRSAQSVAQSRKSLTT
jgi:hypothetical protein